MFTRLTFGVASAPALFQKMMDQILKNIPICACYLDDVIISELNVEECVANLE